MAKIIIVTGKTGSGKTFALKKLQDPNTIFLDDYIKKHFYVKGHSAFQQLVKTYGTDISTENKIDTQKLGQKIFDDDFGKNIKIINEINFPFIKDLLLELKKNHQKKYFIIEMAIYANHEHIFKKYVDCVVYLNDTSVNLENKFMHLKQKKQFIDKVPAFDYKVERDNIQQQIKWIINKI